MIRRPPRSTLCPCTTLFRSANQRVTVDEALRIATANGARASYEEQHKGSITAGKLADFVVLGEDPHEVEPTRIRSEEHTSELQSRQYLVCRLLLEKKTIWLS